jgi:putative transposase
VLYTDNGSDFTSQHLEQVAADLKMRLVFSTPGVARGRGRIERFFSTISDNAKPFALRLGDFLAAHQPAGRV